MVELSISELTPVFVAVGAGTAAMVITLLFVYGLNRAPEEDRHFKDPVPIGMKPIWPLVRWLAPLAARLQSPAMALALEQRLRLAGMEFTMNASQFLAARVVFALSVAALIAWIGTVYVPLLGFQSASIWLFYTAGFAAGWFYLAIWLKDREAVRRAEVQKALPFFLDIITLCVEAGLNLSGAMKQSIEKGPKGVLRNEFLRVLRDVRAGAGRAKALRLMAERLAEPDVTHFISATLQAESMGASLGPVLRAQADQRRSERFLRAEKKAMQAPVKMLLPLTMCIFPCTLIVIVLPIGIKFLQSGY